MKKFLLPMAGLFLGVGIAQAETVTVHLWDSDPYWKPDFNKTEYINNEHYDPVNQELVVNSDGTYTVKQFLNSELDLTFSIGNRKVYNGLEGVKNWFPAEVWEAPVLDFAAPVYTQTVETSAEAMYEVKKPGSDESYMYKIWPRDGLVYYNLGQYVPIPKKELSFPLTIFRNLSVASFQGEDDKGKHYRVWIALKTTLPFGNKVDDFGDENPYYSEANIHTYAIFDMTVSNDPVNVHYVDSSDNTLFQDTQSIILHKEDRSTNVYNFMNSGVALGLYATGKEVAPGKSAIAFTSAFSGNPDEYQPLEGATYSLLTADNQTVTGQVMVRPAGCYAEQLEEISLNKAHYKAYIDIKVGDVTGYNVFEFNGRPLEKGEAYKVMLSVMGKGYNWENLGEFDSNIEIVDDNNFTVYDLFGSGFNVPFLLGEPLPPTSYDQFDAFQELDIDPAFCKWAESKDDKGNTVVSSEEKVVIIPDYLSSVLETNLPVKDGKPLVISNPKIEVYDNNPNLGFWGMPDVCHYKDGDKTRKVYNIYFRSENGANYRITWESKADQSGIADVITDSENAPAEWFTLQGVRVSGENLAPGIYIKRQGSKTVKVLVK